MKQEKKSLPSWSPFCWGEADNKHRSMYIYYLVCQMGEDRAQYGGERVLGLRKVAVL